MKTQITPDTQVSEQIQQILSNRVESCRTALSSSDPHLGIHEARKEFKKIRAAIRLVRETIPKENYKRANAFFRDIARLLSDARDTAALLEVVLKLQRSVEQAQLQSQLTDIANHLMAKKAAVTRYQINGEDILQKALDELSEAEQYLKLLQNDSKGFDTVEGGLKRVYQRGRKMSRVVQNNADPEAFHEFRKRVKYLRYHVDTLQEIWPPMMAVIEDELHELTDSLGADHDLYVLHKTVKDSHLSEEKSFTELYNFIATQRKIHQQHAQLLSRKLYYWESKVFVKWIHHQWELTLHHPHVREEGLVVV